MGAGRTAVECEIRWKHHPGTQPQPAWTKASRTNLSVYTLTAVTRFAGGGKATACPCCSTQGKKLATNCHGTWGEKNTQVRKTQSLVVNQTARTAAHCFMRYQRSLNNKMIKRYQIWFIILVDVCCPAPASPHPVSGALKKIWC